MEAATTPSPALLEANRRLLQYRAQYQAARREADSAAEQGAGDPPWHAERPAVAQTTAESAPASPAPIGWESEAVTAHLRASLRRQEAEAARAEAEASAWLRELEEMAVAKGVAPQTASRREGPAGGRAGDDGTVKVYPDIALGMLREEAAAAGRLWLLLRYLDGDGRGWLRIDSIRQRLSEKESPLHLCSWRQLRNLLRAGEGGCEQYSSGNIRLAHFTSGKLRCAEN